MPLRVPRMMTVAVVWCVLTALLVMLGALLLPACGVRIAGYGIAWCPGVAAKSAVPISVANLQMEFESLQRRYRQLPLCLPADSGLSRSEIVPAPSIGGRASSPRQIAHGAGSAAEAMPVPSAGQGPSNSGEGGVSAGPSGTSGDGNTAPAPDGSSSHAGPQLPTGNAGGAGGGAEGAGTPAAEGSGNSEIAGAGNGNGVGSEDGQANRGACAEAAGGDRSGIVLALDHSRSMALPVDTDDRVATELEALMEIPGPDGAAARRLYDSHIARPGVKRLDVLKSAVKETLADLPGNIDVGLITFAGCNGVLDQGVFPMEQRGALNARVQALRPQPATPAAKALEVGIARAHQMQSRRIILVSDGRDTCGGDPCRIARQSQGVRVDVIAMGGGQVLSCIADETGGRLIESTSGDVVQDLMAQIAASEEEVCR